MSKNYFESDNAQEDSEDPMESPLACALRGENEETYTKSTQYDPMESVLARRWREELDIGLPEISNSIKSFTRKDALSFYQRNYPQVTRKELREKDSGLYVDL